MVEAVFWLTWRFKVGPDTERLPLTEKELEASAEIASALAVEKEPAIIKFPPFNARLVAKFKMSENLKKWFM